MEFVGGPMDGRVWTAPYLVYEVQVHLHDNRSVTVMGSRETVPEGARAGIDRREAADIDTDPAFLDWQGED